MKKVFWSESGEKSASDQAAFTRQNSSKLICGWILMWETTADTLFHCRKRYYELWTRIWVKNVLMLDLFQVLSSPNVKGAVCRILTLLKHKNTIICLQICKKHAKLTYLFIWKTMLQSVILLWSVSSGPECLCLLWFVKPAHCQFTQLYFGTPGCQLAENTAYLISFIIMCARSCWCL